MFLKLILLGALFFLSAFFSGAETALTSINRLRLKELMEKGRKSSKGDKTGWAGEYNHLLTTILIGNNIVGLVASALGASVAMHIFHIKSLVFGTGIMIFLIILVGEITPKIYSKAHAEHLAPIVILPLRLFDRLLSPVIGALISAASFFIRIFGGGRMRDLPSVTERELKEFMDMGEKEGVLEKDEGQMIDSIFDFGDKEVFQVMMPREQIFAIKEGLGAAEVTTLAVESGYSRLPVYRDSLDQITGIIYTKDLLALWKNKPLIKLTDIIQEPYFVLESMKVKDLLKQFQKRKLHMGIVIGESSCTKGLITLEDLVEEIVGEIQDEYDTE